MRARVIVRVVLAAAIFSITPPAMAQQAAAVPAAAAAPSGGPLLPGDAIRIASWREAELRGDFPVDEAGNVSLPVLGAWKVTGVPVSEVKQQILAAFAEQLRNQQVQVTLLRRVSVLGAVHTPGVYLVDPTVGLAQVLAMAGGTTREGKLTGIRIRRGTEVIQLSMGSTNPDFQLTSGDEITVAERSWLARNAQYVIGGALTALAVLASKVL